MFKKLLEKRKALLAKIDATINTAETEKRDLTQAELDQRSADLAEIAKIDKEIETETKLAEHRSERMVTVHTEDGLQDTIDTDYEAAEA